MHVDIKIDWNWMEQINSQNVDTFSSCEEQLPKKNLSTDRRSTAANHKLYYAIYCPNFSRPRGYMRWEGVSSDNLAKFSTQQSIA